MNLPKALLISLALALISTCAGPEGRWENPDRPQETWLRDEASCRRDASDKAEREFARDQQRTPPGYSRTRTYTTSMNAYEAEKREKELFARCMTANGYVRVEQKPRTE